MRTSSAAETSYRQDLHWQQRGLCKDDPSGWDMDVIGMDTDEMREAVRLCKEECPVLAQCDAWARSLPRSRRPQDQVLAGRVYSKAGGIAECIHGHARTPENVNKVGACLECTRIRNRGYKRAKAAQRRAEKSAKGVA